MLTPTASDFQRLSLQTLETALEQVPGYAAWRRYDPGPEAPLDQRYAALPVLTKKTLRDHFPAGFVHRGRNLSDGLSTGAVEFAQTSGSTDDRVTLVFHPAWWEASERAAWQLNSHACRITSGSHPEAVLASPRCVGPGYRAEPLTMAERTIGRHLYLNQRINPSTWTTDEVRRMAEEFNRYQPPVLEADPAYLAPFARMAGGMGLALHQPQLIFLTYSYPSRIYQRQIRRLFTAPLVSSYGSTETGHVFMECEAGRFHQNNEYCRVDFQPWLPRFGGPDRGRMLVTVFRNPWFVALRFDIGDVARLDGHAPCPCGRSQGLTLAAIEGRIKDVTFTPDGRAITVNDIDSSLAGIDAVNGWQLELPEPGWLRLRLLLDPTAAANACQQCSERLRSLYGPRVRIESMPVDSLVHEPSGKFRFVRSAFAVDHSRLWRITS